MVIPRLLFILYCLEAALFLIIVPWTVFWTESVVLVVGSLEGILGSMFVRGLISGIGVLHVWVAIREVIGLTLDRSEAMSDLPPRNVRG